MASSDTVLACESCGLAQRVDDSEADPH